MSPYTILGLPQNAPADAVKSAYRKMAKQYHPDLNPGDEAARSRFDEIQSAYEAITSPKAPPAPKFSYSTVLETFMEVTVEEAFHGAKKNITLRSPYGDTIDLLVDIPAQSIGGTRLRVNGMPEQLQTMDLYITIVIREHGLFSAMGTTIVTRISIDFVTAILGGEVSVETLDGIRYFQVPAGSQNGAIIKLADLGFAIPKTPVGTRDDLIVVLEVRLPTTITPAQRTILENYRAAA